MIRPPFLLCRYFFLVVLKPSYCLVFSIPFLPSEEPVTAHGFHTAKGSVGPDSKRTSICYEHQGNLFRQGGGGDLRLSVPAGGKGQKMGKRRYHEGQGILSQVQVGVCRLGLDSDM